MYNIHKKHTQKYTETYLQLTELSQQNEYTYVFTNQNPNQETEHD